MSISRLNPPIPLPHRARPQIRKRDFFPCRDHTEHNDPPLPGPDSPLRHELRPLHRLPAGEGPVPRLPGGRCQQAAPLLRPVHHQELRRPHGRLLLRLRELPLPAAETPGQALHNEVPDEHAGEPLRDPGAGNRGVRRAGRGPPEMPAVRTHPLRSSGPLPALRPGVVRKERPRTSSFSYRSTISFVPLPDLPFPSGSGTALPEMRRTAPSSKIGSDATCSSGRIPTPLASPWTLPAARLRALAVRGCSRTAGEADRGCACRQSTERHSGSGAMKNAASSISPDTRIGGRNTERHNYIPPDNIFHQIRVYRWVHPGADT